MDSCLIYHVYMRILYHRLLDGDQESSYRPKEILTWDRTGLGQRTLSSKNCSCVIFEPELIPVKLLTVTAYKLAAPTCLYRVNKSFGTWLEILGIVPHFQTKKRGSKWWIVRKGPADIALAYSMPRYDTPQARHTMDLLQYHQEASYDGYDVNDRRRV